MKYGWITTNIADLWTQPKFNSERASQLLFAEPIRIVSERSGFYSVRQIDDYKGWVDKRFVALTTRKAYTEHLSARDHFVNASTSALHGRHGSPGVAPYHLYYGTKLRIGRTKDNLAHIILPDKTGLLIKKSNLVPINKRSTRAVTGRKLVAQATRFLGVPYLWGGVTTAGFDCSGLVQTVLSRFGLYIPRDTKHQIRCGEKVERDCIKTGDLVFFKRHVGFAIGKDKVIHSSVGGGGVRINSLTADKADYREDLHRDFNQARRMICST